MTQIFESYFVSSSCHHDASYTDKNQSNEKNICLVTLTMKYFNGFSIHLWPYQILLCINFDIWSWLDDFICHNQSVSAVWWQALLTKRLIILGQLSLNGYSIDLWPYQIPVLPAIRWPSIGSYVPIKKVSDVMTTTLAANEKLCSKPRSIYSQNSFNGYSTDLWPYQILTLPAMKWPRYLIVIVYHNEKIMNDQNSPNGYSTDDTDLWPFIKFW